MTTIPREALIQTLQSQPQIEFAVLVGSSATGSTHADSAGACLPQLDWLTVLSATETLRRELAEALHIATNTVDLIELRRANLALRASVAEEGVQLVGQDTLAWAHFLQRSWRELEDFYWVKCHTA